MRPRLVGPGAIPQTALIALGVLLFFLLTVPARGDTNIQTFRPGVWIDPDGCEHWVMDDGWEGYMTPNVRPDGRPVCYKAHTCGAVRTAGLFDGNRTSLTRSQRGQLADYLGSVEAVALILVGHTDVVAADGSDVALTRRHAEAIADVARDAGVRVSDIRGYGGRKPRVSNATAEGRAMNQRVDVLCLR